MSEGRQKLELYELESLSFETTSTITEESFSDSSTSSESDQIADFVIVPHVPSPTAANVQITGPEADQANSDKADCGPTNDELIEKMTRFARELDEQRQKYKAIAHSESLSNSTEPEVTKDKTLAVIKEDEDEKVFKSPSNGKEMKRSVFSSSSIGTPEDTTERAVEISLPNKTNQILLEDIPLTILLIILLLFVEAYKSIKTLF